jgi:GLPGLI family protein
MKKMFLAIAVASMSVLSANAQKKGSFEGKVVYELNFDNAGLPPEALQMLKGAEAITFIKEDKRRVDISMPMQSTSSIMDNKSKQIVTLMDIMGQKYLIRTTEADIKKEEEKAPETTIKYVDGTKTIAGYTCKKAEVTQKSKDGKEEVSTVYYTEEIPAAEMKSAYKGLKGFPMEYTVKQGGVQMKFICKSANKEKVEDSKFEIPKEGYTETTMEDFQKEMMKLGGGQ